MTLLRGSFRKRELQVERKRGCMHACEPAECLGVKLKGRLGMSPYWEHKQDAPKRKWKKMWSTLVGEGVHGRCTGRGKTMREAKMDASKPASICRAGRPAAKRKSATLS